MIFSASAEVDRHSGPSIQLVQRHVEPAINEALEKSSLSAIEVKIRYVPIVMDAEARQRYPARSRMRKKQRLYDCAPQLDYDPFVTGSWNDQVHVYLDGLRECAPRLSEVGASPAQAQEFLAILDQLIIELTKDGAPLCAHPEEVRQPGPRTRETGITAAQAKDLRKFLNRIIADLRKYGTRFSSQIDRLRECASRLPERGASAARAQEFFDTANRLMAEVKAELRKGETPRGAKGDPDDEMSRER